MGYFRCECCSANHAQPLDRHQISKRTSNCIGTQPKPVSFKSLFSYELTLLSSSTLKELPAGLAIRPRFKRSAIILPRYDAYKSLLFCVASLAFQPWSDRQFTVKCNSKPKVGVDIVGNNRPDDSPLTTVYATYSIIGVAQWWKAQQKHVAETNFGIVGDGTSLGIGRVYSQIGSGDESAITKNNLTANQSSDVFSQSIAVGAGAGETAFSSISTATLNSGNAPRVKIKVYFAEHLHQSVMLQISTSC